jgi:hypothetical protein
MLLSPDTTLPDPRTVANLLIAGMVDSDGQGRAS